MQSLASAVGQIISMNLAMGPITRLRTRALYAVLNSRSSWADKCYLPAEAREELEFWQTNVQFLNGRSIWFSSGTTRVVHSDASSTGYEIPVTVWNKLEGQFQKKTWANKLELRRKLHFLRLRDGEAQVH